MADDKKKPEQPDDAENDFDEAEKNATDVKAPDDDDEDDAPAATAPQAPAPTGNPDVPTKDDASAAQAALSTPLYNGPASPTDPQFVEKTAAKPLPQNNAPPSTTEELGHVAGQAAKVAAMGPLAPTVMAMPDADTSRQYGADFFHGLSNLVGDKNPELADLLRKAGDKVAPDAKPGTQKPADAGAAKPPAPKTIHVQPPTGQPAPQAQVPSAPVPPASPAPDMDMPNPEDTKANTTAAQEANTATGDVNKKIAAAEQPFLEQRAQDSAALATQMQQDDINNRKALAAHIQQAEGFNDKQNQFVNSPDFSPSHYWHSLDTPQKVMYGIGIALNTIVAGVTKGRIPNIALDYFTDAIHRDTDQQMAKYHQLGAAAQQQMGLARMAMESFGDERLAGAAINKAKLDNTAAQMEAMAGRYSDEKISAAVKTEAAKIRDEGTKELAGAYKERNEARLQGSEINRNNLTNRKDQALLPYQIKQEQLKNENMEAERTVTDANGNSKIVAPSLAKWMHQNQAQAEQRINALHAMRGLAASSDSLTNFSDKDSLRVALAKVYPGAEGEAILKNLPDKFSPADASRVIDDLIKTEQQMYPAAQ